MSATMIRQRVFGMNSEHTLLRSLQVGARIVAQTGVLKKDSPLYMLMQRRSSQKQEKPHLVASVLCMARRETILPFDFSLRKSEGPKTTYYFGIPDAAKQETFCLRFDEKKILPTEPGKSPRCAIYSRIGGQPLEAYADADERKDAQATFVLELEAKSKQEFMAYLIEGKNIWILRYAAWIEPEKYRIALEITEKLCLLRGQEKTRLEIINSLHLLDAVREIILKQDCDCSRPHYATGLEKLCPKCGFLNKQKEKVLERRDPALFTADTVIIIKPNLKKIEKGGEGNDGDTRTANWRAEQERAETEIVPRTAGGTCRPDGALSRHSKEDPKHVGAAGKARNDVGGSTAGVSSDDALSIEELESILREQVYPTTLSKGAISLAS